MTHGEILYLLFKNEMVANSHFDRGVRVQQAPLALDTPDEASAVAAWMTFHLAFQIKHHHTATGSLRHGLLGMSLRPMEIRKQWSLHQEEDVVFFLEGLQRDAIRLSVQIKRSLLSPAGAPRYSYEGYEGGRHGWDCKWMARGEKDQGTATRFFITTVDFGPPPAILTRG